MAQLESNTQELREILNTVNALPTAGEGGGGSQCDMEIKVIDRDQQIFLENGVEISIISGTVNDVWTKVNNGERVVVWVHFDYWYGGVHHVGYSQATSVTISTDPGEYEFMQVEFNMPGANRFHLWGVEFYSRDGVDYYVYNYGF